MRTRAGFPALLFALSSVCLPAAARAQGPEKIPPLPPPVTRSLYRSLWFELLNAQLEDDGRATDEARERLMKAALAVGVFRLSDFSRAAVQAGRRAEVIGKTERALRAYEVAQQLDDGNFDAAISRVGLLVRGGSYGKALSLLPAAAAALANTRETRLALASAAGLWLCLALAAAVLATILLLAARRRHVLFHDVTELAAWPFGLGGALPLSLVILFLPLAFGLGPVWILLYLSALVFPYAGRPARRLLVAGLAILALLPAIVAVISRENILQRSPIYVAAVDLEERREDASAEDGLRQASLVFPEDPDVWFLRGIYAERAGDNDRALAAYDLAVKAAPGDYRPYLNRGNLHFQEGDTSEAIRDFEAAAQRAPGSAEAYYNLSVARTEAYDFDGQAAALKKAREISESKVASWAAHPTLARVISARYTVGRAREKVKEWNSEPRGRRLPGHTPPSRVVRALISPLALGVWAALALGLLHAFVRSRWGPASECIGCGRPCCRRCRRYGDPSDLCASCARMRKDPAGIDAQVAHTREVRRRSRQRTRACRITSFFFPGAHLYFSDKPAAGFLVLLAFCFLLSAARIGVEPFDVRPLALSSQWPVAFVAALAAAAALWAASVISAWRHPHGA